MFLTGIMGVRKELKLLLQIRHIAKWLGLIGLMGFLLDTTAFIGLRLSPAGIGTALLKCDVLIVNVMSALLYKEKFSEIDWMLTVLMLAGVFLLLGIDPMHMDLFNPGNIFFILSALFVSINAFLIKHVQHHRINPAKDMVIAYYNNFITLVLFTAAAFVTGQIGELPMIAGGGALGLALLLSGIGQTMIYVVYYHNLRRHPVWLVKVILLLMPIVSALLSLLLFGERMTVMQLCGLVVVLLCAAAILMTHHRRESAGKK